MTESTEQPRQADLYNPNDIRALVEQLEAEDNQIKGKLVILRELLTQINNTEISDDLT